MERDSTAAAGATRTPKPQAGKYRGEFAPPSALASFKLDEGYSDETRSQAENEVIQTSDEGVGLPSWILAHNETDRAGNILPFSFDPYGREKQMVTLSSQNWLIVY